jgi:hypothetical protein
MINRVLAAVVASLWLMVPALAEEAPDTEGGRYLFNKVANGYLRLDTRTGEVALCSQHNVGWACQLAPEERAVLENEVARLRSENAALKKDILSRGLPLPAGTMPEPPVVGETGPTPPTASDLDRAKAFVARMWHGLVDAIARAQRQVLNNKS